MEVTESWNGLGWNELKEESTASLSKWMLPKSKMSHDYYMDFFLVLSFWTRSKERRTRQSGKLKNLSWLKPHKLLFAYSHTWAQIILCTPRECAHISFPYHVFSLHSSLSRCTPAQKKDFSPQNMQQKWIFPKATSALHLLLTAKPWDFFIICSEKKKKKKCDFLASE